VRQLLAAGMPPNAQRERKRQICNCLDVDESTILARLPHCHGVGEERLQPLQEALRCGTQCGSCLPELRRLLRQAPMATPTVTA
jgi:assimilatory nitrate reductase catalytic subunit